MARRGQVGTIAVSGKWYVVRYWQYPAGQERVHASVKLCLADPKAAGHLSKGERRRRANEIVFASGVNNMQRFVEVNNGTTFRKQADWYLNYMTNRKNRPIKPVTLSTWTSCIDGRLNPVLGDMLLADVKNKAVKGLIEEFHKVGLAPKTISNYIKLVKSIVASALDEEGEQLFPRKWNNDFLDMPAVQNQNQPVFSEQEVERIVANSTGRYQVLYALLAATGMRVGEALGLEVKHLTDNCRTIQIEQSCWMKKLQLPKTRNSLRKIDVTSEVAGMLREFTAGRTGLVFSTFRGTPLDQSWLITHLHALEAELGLQTAGFHSLRRYRNTWLLKQQTPESLIKYWMGHAKVGMTGLYDKVADDQEFRLKVTEQVGIGFQVPMMMSVRPRIDEVSAVASMV